MSGVQLFGVEDTVQAYDNNAIPCFSICCGKDQNFKYDGWEGVDTYRKPTLAEGHSQLEAYLELLARSGSTAPYTLKIYADLKDKQRIKPSTEPDLAIKFKIFDQSGHGQGLQGNELMTTGRYQPRTNPLVEAINGLKEMILTMKQEPEEEEEEEETVTEHFVGVLKDPDKIKAYMDAFKYMIGSEAPGTVAAVTVNKIVAEENKTEDIPANEQERWQRIADAVDILAADNPGIVEQLEALADIKKRDPRKFTGLISMLNTFK